MRGKYKRKKLQKKYQELFQYWRSNPDEFIEEFYGWKLNLYRKLVLKLMMKGVK